MRAIVRAEKECALGNLWRAKEILQGSIPNMGYDYELFEKLGTVLLEMGDLPEAGRFLFLSGRRLQAYDEAIRVFLWKHKKDQHALYASFPRVAKLVKRADYPETVSMRLKELGFPEILRNEHFTFSQTNNNSWIPAIAGWAIIGSILALLLLGLIKLVEIWHWIKTR
ncbi:MAG TPA: DUF6584 family protein [Pyrinomonadaceae bacterium]|nr:DUF6584 family protein [Pyrinomonadaceae bacterium]